MRSRQIVQGGYSRAVVALLGGLTAWAACKSPSVDQPNATLTALQVTPSQADLAPAATQQFAVTGEWSDGGNATLSVNWSATGGTIAAGGLYTAGATTGTFRVIATHEGGTLADTAAVTITSPPAVLTAVVIQPASVSLMAGTTQQFTVSGTWSDGGHTVPAVTYSATGGAISAGGLYTAGGTAGLFRVIVVQQGGSHADTAAVTITVPPPTLTQLILTPSSASLVAGATQQFTVSANWSDGSHAVPAVSYSATGGTLSAGGLYTAGGTAGSFRAIVVQQGGTVADTSAVTITAAGATTLLTEGFEDNNAGARGWYANTSPPISTTEHHGGVGSLKETWQTGAMLPDNGVSLRHLFTSTDRVYVRYWVKYSTNFVGSQKPYHPHEIQLLTDADDMWIGPSATHLTTYIETNWQNGGIPVLAATDILNIDQTKIGVDLTNVTEQRAVAGCNGESDGYPTGCYSVGPEYWNEKVWVAAQPAFTNSAGPGYKNDWHKVEVYYQLNTIAAGKGQNNGVVQYWFDGTLKVDLHNVLFRTGANPTIRFNQILLAYYIGDGSPVTQTLWVDDLVIATGPVP